MISDTEGKDYPLCSESPLPQGRGTWRKVAAGASLRALSILMRVSIRVSSYALCPKGDTPTHNRPAPGGDDHTRPDAYRLPYGSCGE